MASFCDVIVIFGHQVGGGRFKSGVVHVNDDVGKGILDARSGKPLWVRWEGKPDKESYYFQGKHLIDVWPSSNHPPAFRVYLRARDGRTVCWLNRDGATAFTERVFYDTNGILSGDEVLYSQAWYQVERRYQHNGIIVNGEWRQLAFDTNGMWTINARSTSSASK